MKKLFFLTLGVACLIPATSKEKRYPYPIVDTGQIRCYDDTSEIEFPKASAKFFGQDAHNSVFSSNAADYMAIGEALGWMEDRRTGKKTLLDVHGAGSQRSDPKSGDPKQFPYGRGPQGDVIRIYNYVLCVRGGKATPRTTGPKLEMKTRPNRRGGDDGGGNAPPSFVKRLDKNGDGKVSKDEFDGPSRHFGHLDKNNDGFVTDDEAPKGPPRRR